jgi:hypothetical protein
MAHRGRLRRLEREAKSEGVILKLRNGDIKVFSDLDVFGEMFLAKTDLLVRGESRPSEVLDAVRGATPESRRAFEEEYGTIDMVGHIVAGDHEGGWVEEYRLVEDGGVKITRFEGGSEGALRIRQGILQGGSPPAGSFDGS